MLVAFDNGLDAKAESFDKFFGDLAEVREVERLSIRDGVVQSRTKASYARIKVGPDCGAKPCDVVLGSKLAEALELIEGNTFQLMLEGVDGNPVTIKQTVDRISDTGLYDHDRYYIRINHNENAFKGFIDLDSIALKLEDPLETKTAVQKVQEILDKHETATHVSLDWRTLNAPLFLALGV